MGGFRRSPGALCFRSHPAGSGGSPLPHPIPLVKAWAILMHAFKFLLYISLHFGHLNSLLFIWATCPHLWQVFDVSIASFFVRYLTSIPSKSALYSTIVWSFLKGRLWNLLFSILDFFEAVAYPFEVLHHYYWLWELFGIGDCLVGYYVELLVYLFSLLKLLDFIGSMLFFEVFS